MADNTLSGSSEIGGIVVTIAGNVEPLRQSVAQAKTIASSAEKELSIAPAITLNAQGVKSQVAGLSQQIKAVGSEGLTLAPKIDARVVAGQLSQIARSARDTHLSIGVSLEDKRIREQLATLAQDARRQIRSIDQSAQIAARAPSSTPRTAIGNAPGGDGPDINNLNLFSRRGLARFLRGNDIVGSATAAFGTIAAVQAVTGIAEAATTIRHPESILRQHNEIGSAYDPTRDQFAAGQAGELSGVQAAQKIVGSVEGIPILGMVARLGDALTGLSASLDKDAQAAERAMQAHAAAAKEVPGLYAQQAEISGDVGAVVRQQDRDAIVARRKEVEISEQPESHWYWLGASKARRPDSKLRAALQLTEIAAAEREQVFENQQQAIVQGDNRRIVAAEQSASTFKIGDRGGAQDALIGRRESQRELVQANQATELSAIPEQSTAMRDRVRKRQQAELDAFDAETDALVRELARGRQELIAGAKFTIGQANAIIAGAGEQSVSRNTIAEQYRPQIEKAERDYGKNSKEANDLRDARAADEKVFDYRSAREGQNFIASSQSQIRQSNLRIGFDPNEAERENIRDSFRGRIEGAEDKYGKGSNQVKQLEAELEAKLAEQTASRKVKADQYVVAAHADANASMLRASNQFIAADRASFEASAKAKIDALRKQGATAQEVAAEQGRINAQRTEFNANQQRQQQVTSLGFRERQFVASARGEGEDITADVIGQIAAMRRERITADAKDLPEIQKTQRIELDSAKKQLTRPEFAEEFDVQHRFVGGVGTHGDNDLKDALALIDKEKGKLTSGTEGMKIGAPDSEAKVAPPAEVGAPGKTEIAAAQPTEIAGVDTANSWLEKIEANTRPTGKSLSEVAVATTPANAVQPKAEIVAPPTAQIQPPQAKIVAPEPQHVIAPPTNARITAPTDGAVIGGGDEPGMVKPSQRERLVIPPGETLDHFRKRGSPLFNIPSSVGRDNRESLGDGAYRTGRDNGTAQPQSQRERLRIPEGETLDHFRKRSAGHRIVAPKQDMEIGSSEGDGTLENPRVNTVAIGGGKNVRLTDLSSIASSSRMQATASASSVDGWSKDQIEKALDLFQKLLDKPGGFPA